MQKHTNSIWKLVLAVCLLGLAVSVGVLIYNSYRKGRNEQALEELARQTSGGKEEALETHPTEAPSADGQTAVSQESQESQKAWEDMTLEEKRQLLEEELGVSIPEKELDFTQLQADRNPDIYAWVYIPDTKIDYPVLQHPENNAYYLYYNLDGSKSYPGCIYSENYNTKDFTDFNTVLYGHNMKDGSMFAGLHKFEDSQYFEEHPYVYVYTEEDILVYQIYAAYEFSNVHLLKGYELTTAAGKERYLEEVREVRSMNSNFADEAEVDAESHILTLSTCIANKPDNRFLVQAVLLNDLLEDGAEE